MGGVRWGEALICAGMVHCLTTSLRHPQTDSVSQPPPDKPVLHIFRQQHTAPPSVPTCGFSRMYFLKYTTEKKPATLDLKLPNSLFADTFRNIQEMYFF